MKEIIFSKVAALQFATSIKNELLHMYFFTNYAKFVTPTGVVFVHYQNISVTSVKESSRTTQNYFWREFKNPTPSKMELLAIIVCHKTLLHFRCSRVPEAASNSGFNVLQRLHWNTTSVIIITLNYQIFSSMASGLDLNSFREKFSSLFWNSQIHFKCVSNSF